jgi:hypothetical protein
MLAGENANVFGALVARQAIDIGDDFILFAPRFDKRSRAAAYLVKQSPSFPHGAKLALRLR